MNIGFEWVLPGILGDLIDFMFRPICLICRGPIKRSEESGADLGNLVCSDCYGDIREIPEPGCRRCGSPDVYHRGGDCATCRRLPKKMGLIRSSSLMEGAGGKLVHLYKYQGWKMLAGVLALKVVSSRWSDNEFWDADMLLPVPISLVRKRERGYNQSKILAENISDMIGIPVGSGYLQRISWKCPQVGLSYRERMRNVLNAFRVPDRVRADLTGRRVILVDDVITTGATIHACYQALVESGVEEVSCVSFGRAESHVEY